MNPDKLHEPIDTTAIDAILFNFRAIKDIPCPYTRNACIIELAEKFAWSSSNLFWLYNLGYHPAVGAEQVIANTRVGKITGA